MRQYVERTPQAPRQLVVDEKLRAYTKAYLQKSNVGCEWFRDAYTRVDDWNAGGDEPCSAKAIYSAFTEANEYTDMSRDDKKLWGQGKFIAALQRDLPASDFKERLRVDGRDWRRVVVNWRMNDHD